MEQAVTIALVVVVCLGVLLLRLWGAWRRGGPGGGDPEALERWAAHVYRGDRRD
ncbi:MAG: hypothetical protein WCB85_05575 [Candidatus Dormiibacterota bacterium]